jgi:hypothetical protein
VSPLAISHQPSAISSRSRWRGKLRQHEDLAQFEAGDDSTSSELGDVVLVAPTDSLDEAVDSQAFELSGNLAGGLAG